jgi:tetratricopeptide (TPR) repeat protein
VWNGPRSEEVIGLWNFLRQVIISKELARRLEFYNGATGVSLTSSIVASLIIADLWVQNVTISLVDAKVDTSTKRTVTDEEANKAQQLITEGDDANTGKDHDSALKLYAKAVGIDPHNPVYLSRHAGALLLTERIERAAMEAYMATYFDPMYAGGWECLALTQLKRGHARKAKQSYEKALEIADSAIQPRLNQGLTIANNMIEFKRQAINSANTNAWKRTLIKEYLDEDWDMSCKAYRIRSRVHERQAEGLLQFAERLKWPYIKEARTRIEDVYGELQSGQEIDHHLIDWLFGVMLPGKWFSFKIMSALILCTPSLALSLHAAPYLDCGLSLPKCSYWRARTVLGRVLGSLPDISSINGWLGPCPPIVFDKQELLNDAGKPRHIRLKARPVAPFTGDSRLSRHDTIEQKPGEDYDAYVKSLNDLTKWAAPTPPTRQDMAYTLKAIRLTQLPLESSMEEKLAAQQITESKAESEAEFRASLVFRIEPSVKIMTFTLYSNPVFVTAPSCHLGPHEVHERHLLSFNRSAVTVDKLRDFEHDNGDDQAGIMLINATGKGAEVVARAWCAERGKNALIRRVNGPCYACAMRAASGAGLRLGVLIWVS